jgi:hypothetical protein
MIYKILKTGVFFTLLFLQGCQADEQYGTNNWKKSAPFYHGEYVDFESFKKGRLCADVRFTCLVESQDKLVVNTPLKNGLDSFELTAEVMEKYHAIIKRWRDEEDGLVKDESMKAAELSEAFFDKVEEKKFLKEMEAQLEKEFPGFWKDTPKQVRYRWIQRAMNKAKVFGYKAKNNNGIVELCARIGLNFDKDPKWEAITKFIAAKDVHILYACDYIDYTVFEKDKGYSGVPITDWSMRRASGWLPEPKTPYPRLND